LLAAIFTQMNASVALVFLVTISGAITTYLYDEDASFPARLCAGACLGITALSLIGFVISSFFGLTTGSILLTALICAFPFALLAQPTYASAVQRDLSAISKATRRLTSQPDLQTIGYICFYLVTALVLWRVFSKAMIQDQTGISTGLLNNFGDLPFHLSVITGFAFGNNFPPEDPTYAGVRFTYPFLSDFASAMFVKSGADLQQSMFIENFILALSFVGLLHRWALVMLKDRLAAILTPLLVLLNGGFGWVLLFTNADKNEYGLLGVLLNLQPSVTVIPDTTWRWGNAISALLIPQRGFLMGLPLAVMVFTQWWLATSDEKKDEEIEGSRAKVSKKKSQKKNVEEQQPGSQWWQASIRRMVSAGIIAGLLPLAHAHSFVVVMANGWLSRLDSAAMARMVCFLSSCINRGRSPTLVVDIAHSSSSWQLLCVGVRLG
jgi:hypothetical protein